MDLLFGASAGVMLAASFFSLLGPSVEYSRELGYARSLLVHLPASCRSRTDSFFSQNEAWFPPLFGFLTGVAFIKLVDCFMPAGADPHHHSSPPSRTTSPRQSRNPKRDSSEDTFDRSNGDIEVDAPPSSTPNSPAVELDEVGGEFEQPKTSLTSSGHQMRHWTKKRVWLLVIAVTLHNIPEGIVLGVSYGSIVGEDSTNKNGPSLKDAILLTVALGTLRSPELCYNWNL
jgi:zinc transporter ZupT